MKKSGLFVLGIALSSFMMSSNVVADDDDDDHREYRPKRHYERHGHHDSHAAYAKVVHVDPIIVVSRTSHPQQQCWDERVSSPSQGRTRHNAAGAMIIGGIIGGVVGHQVGDRGGNGDTAKLLGTLVGASIGHDMGGNHDAQPATTVVTQHCRNTTHYENDERIVGYRVTYRYRGQTFVTRTDHHPGSRIRVNVAVTPEDEDD